MVGAPAAFVVGSMIEGVCRFVPGVDGSCYRRSRNVRYGSLADMLGWMKKRPLYPWKQTSCFDLDQLSCGRWQLTNCHYERSSHRSQCARGHGCSSGPEARRHQNHDQWGSARHWGEWL